MPSRRHVLALLASTPFATSACSPSSAPDYAAAWRSPGSGEADPRRFALAHAILAPNPHNTQPWQVELRGEDEMLLYCDLERRLPFTDPLDRQITVGCGAFLYLCWMAIAHTGNGCEMSIFPDGAPDGGARLDNRPFARILVKGGPPTDGVDSLFEHVIARRTNRNDYESRIPTEELLNTVARAADAWMEPPPNGAASLAAHAETGPSQVAAIRDLVWRAFDREMRTRGAQVETYQWLRFGKAERARHRDGLYIDVPVPGVLRALGMLDEADIVDPESNANKRAAADWKRKVDSAPAFLWITTPDDTPTTRLLAGMAYARMNLAATAAGLAMHPWSQALQEYEEMADLYAETKTLLGAGAGETVQMLARIGYAEPAEPAARRDMADMFRT
ncbi:MAG: nitroreductase family protein [Hyphomonadaceae bacterium]|nr:nitroreductase family protein [Hyphomonadaceae bacterium]